MFAYFKVLQIFFILMHLQMQRNVWLDNVINLRQYIYCQKPDVIT